MERKKKLTSITASFFLLTFLMFCYAMFVTHFGALDGITVDKVLNLMKQSCKTLLTILEMGSIFSPPTTACYVLHLSFAAAEWLRSSFVVGS